MIEARKHLDRGHANHGWLDSYHTFSFADYHDPAHMGFSSLRVINEDRVAPGAGFATHSHRDMEIITYVLEGTLEHKDSLGNGSIIRPGDVQRMSAGRGVRHSEFNGSKTAGVHFLQIWILPEKEGIDPGYEQTHFPETERHGKLRLIAAPDGDQGAVRLHQDARIYASVLKADDSVQHALAPGRHAYVQVARGDVALNGHDLHAGDGARVSAESLLDFRTTGTAEFLLFDLA